MEHYQQNPSDPESYTLVEKETKTALTDTEVTPEVKSYPGFQSPQPQTAEVKGYEVTCIRYYYGRNIYPVTYVKNNGEVDGRADVMYGAAISELSLIHIFSNPNGWQPGASYKLTLKNDQLYFTGFDKTIREYDFTVYREETKNVELNREIRYIHTRELSNLTVNGKAADSVSVAVMTVGVDGCLLYTSRCV